MRTGRISRGFPYFFVGTFIEGNTVPREQPRSPAFPYFFVGTFIEGANSGR